MIWLALACTPTPPDSVQSVSLVYQSSVDGEIEPCG
jgi:hypothetical protein